jgi:ankyrin repeat protein
MINRKMAASKEWYELRTLVAERKFEEATALLTLMPSLGSAVNGLGETVLHYLAVENDLEGVSWLSSHGFDLNTRNAFGTPVAFEVAQLDYKELFDWFVSNGADVKCRDGEGQSIREYVLGFGLEDVAKHLESLRL